jgi:hypothetical protein
MVEIEIMELVLQKNWELVCSLGHILNQTLSDLTVDIVAAWDRFKT